MPETTTTNALPALDRVDVDTPFTPAPSLEREMFQPAEAATSVASPKTENFLDRIDVERVIRNSRALDALEEKIAAVAPSVVEYAQGVRYRSAVQKQDTVSFEAVPLSPEAQLLAEKEALKRVGRQLPELSEEDLKSTDAYAESITAIQRELRSTPVATAPNSPVNSREDALSSLSDEKKALVSMYLEEGAYFTAQDGWELEESLVEIGTDQLGLYDDIFDVYNELLQAEGKAKIAYKASTAETSAENYAIMEEYGRQLEVARSIIRTMDEVADLLVNIRFRRRLTELVDGGYVRVRDVSESGLQMNDLQEGAIRNDGTTDYLKAKSHNVAAPAVILEFAKDYDNMVRFWGDPQGREQFNSISEMGKWFFIGRSSQESWFGRDTIRHISATLGNSVEKVTRFTIPEGTQMAMSGLSRMTKIIEGKLTQRRYGSDIQLYMPGYKKEETADGATEFVKQPYMSEDSIEWRSLVSNNPTLSNYQKQMRNLREQVTANPDMDEVLRQDLIERLDTMTDAVQQQFSQDIAENPDIRRVRQFQYIKSVEAEQTRKFLLGQELDPWSIHNEALDRAVALDKRDN